MKSRDDIEFGFDMTRTIADAQMADWEDHADKKRKAQERRDALRAQRQSAGGRAQRRQRPAAAGAQQMDGARSFKMPNGATATRTEPAE